MGNLVFCECCGRKKNDENKEISEENSPIIDNLQAASGEEKDNSSPQSRLRNKEEIDENDKFDIKLDHLYNKGDYIIKIMIDSLEITYKLCDDFGSYFKPFIEIVFGNQSKIISYLDDKLNSSILSDNASGINNTDMNNSFNLNNVSELERFKSQANASSNVKEKYYPFKTEEIMSGNSANSYFSISFLVKNTTVHSHLTSAHPSIIIGEAHIPINLIGQKSNCYFEGYLRVMLRNIQEIGKLKVKLTITDQNAASSLLENKIDHNNSINLNNSQDTNLIYNQVEYWENELINFTDIDPALLDKFFIREHLDQREKHFRSANRIIQEKVYDASTLYKYYTKSIQEENLVSLYQILNQLLKLAQYLDFNPINEFFKLLGETESEKFYLIPEMTSYNVYIVERFLMFIFYSQKYFKSNRSVIIRNNRFLNDTSLIDMIYRNVKNLIELYKQNSNDSLYCDVIRQCCLWCINNLNELLTQPTLSKDMSDELKKSEYTSIYNNCICVMSYRVCLMKMIDIYSTDSQLMSGLFRIFRKASQQITNDSTSFLDRNKIDGRPKEITKKFKILLIEKYDGLFIYSLRLMLQKYQHYPELHVNILIIIYQITSSIEYKNLLFAANKIGLKDFGENFVIYRGKLKVFWKVLNNLHLNVLANFSELTKNENEIIKEKEIKYDYENCLTDLFSNLKNFFKIRKNNKKRVEEFIQLKSMEIEVQEIISRIFNNLTQSSIINNLLLSDTCIFDDMIDFLGKLSGQQKQKDNKDFIKTIIEKKMKSREDPRKNIMSITENCFSAIRNLILKVKENKKEFKKFISSIEVTHDKKSLSFLIKCCVKNLKFFQINSPKIDCLHIELNNLIESNWSSE